MNEAEPPTNVLIALANIVQHPVYNLKRVAISGNRVNQQGETLEQYIKGVFASCHTETDEHAINTAFSEAFAYLGNQNNPPDIVIHGNDAIEIKKLETSGSIPRDIALNSSYPKAYLQSDSPMISKACRDCEGVEISWRKDVLYVIGVFRKKTTDLIDLFCVYGSCYAASPEHYEKLRLRVVEAVRGDNELPLSETKELGRVNRVDPLGITYLRLRGMWGIRHPAHVFAAFLSPMQPTSSFRLTAIMPETKYNSFPTNDRAMLEALSGVTVQRKNVPSPDNPAQLMPVRIVEYQI